MQKHFVDFYEQNGNFRSSPKTQKQRSDEQKRSARLKKKENRFQNDAEEKQQHLIQNLSHFYSFENKFSFRFIFE